MVLATKDTFFGIGQNSKQIFRLTFGSNVNVDDISETV